ncbi:MAG: hypothetical protein WBB67_07480 [bacterium]
MPNLWYDITKWLDDVSKVVGKEAGDLTVKGRLKVEIFELHRKLREYYIVLGNLVFEEVFVKKNGTWQRKQKTRGLVANIKRLRTKLKKKQQEYNKVGVKTKKRKKK